MVNQNPEVILRRYDLLVEEIKRSIDDINKRLNKISSDHEELRKKPDVPNEYQEFKYFLNGKMKSVLDSIESFSIQIKDVRNQLLQEVSRNEKERLDKTDDKIKIKEILYYLEEHKKDFTHKMNGLGDSISQSSTSVKDYATRSIEKLKQELSVSPSSILETNNSILRKIEECKMDCSNSMLKLSNFETQFTLFQRKLENLEIRIKKFELEKQG